MKIVAGKIGVAIAIASAILWGVCSLFVLLAPEGMLAMSGHMVHADLSTIQWHIGLSGFLIGMIAWAVLAGITGWLAAIIYNRLI